jgi:hypothetical protein
MPSPDTIRLIVSLLAVQLILPSTGAAVLSGGGGSKTTDCLAVFDAGVNNPISNPRNVVCEDGTACDEDGDINGICEVAVRVCANSTAFPACTLNGIQSITVEHALDNGDLKFDPDFQALQTAIDGAIAPPTNTTDLCTDASSIRVPIKGPLTNNACRKSRKKLRLETASDIIGGRIYTDKDTLRITCLPSTTDFGCDPQVLFDSTFDRIQKQVFNQSCALSGCHDSQSQAGDMLLEVGASHAELVNQDPSNPSALGAGWKRVTRITPSLGDPATSFIFHKLEGTLPTPAYGERMPFGRPKLPSALRELIEIWIQNGAPDETGGWVPGTF